jgi:hypothetical protein
MLSRNEEINSYYSSTLPSGGGGGGDSNMPASPSHLGSNRLLHFLLISHITKRNLTMGAFIYCVFEVHNYYICIVDYKM